MNRKAKGIIQRALKNGFDLSTIKNYDQKLFLDKIYTYLVDKKYFCFAEENIIVVSDYTFEDLAELEIGDSFMKITPIRTDGIFDLLLAVFKFVADNPDLMPEEDISTEEDEPKPDDIPSEEFDWI